MFTISTDDDEDDTSAICLHDNLIGKYIIS